MSNYTEEEVLASKEYWEGYETYSYKGGRSGTDLWSTKYNGGRSPYGNNSDDSAANPKTPHDLWMAGAFSAFGTSKGHRAAYTKPTYQVSFQPKQLDLFE